MEPFDIEAYVNRSQRVQLSDIRWEDVPRYELKADALRTLRYMQDIESHTIVYLRELLSTRAIDDPDVASFLACWFYEETFHGRALAEFLRAAGHEIPARVRSGSTWSERIERAAVKRLSRLRPDFIAVHMTWGAINELTTLTGYRRLARLADHPVLSELLDRIVRDESRHFQFYFHQAERRLQDRRTQRLVRFMVDHFWAPVGSGVQPAEETRFLAGYLLSGADGSAAARRVDQTIRRLPGFEDVKLLEAWVEREIQPNESQSRTGSLAERAVSSSWSLEPWAP